MDHFEYRDGRLMCEGVDLANLAAAVRTPAYVYSGATLAEHYVGLARAFEELDPLICFSVKSCSNLSILKRLAEMGAGLDVVSGGELCRARVAGVAPSKIVYAGVGKKEHEILAALGRPGDDEPEAGHREPIALFNVESEGEFQRIARLAASVGVKARAALRVNPDVNPNTHKYTTTGTAETKFGVDIGRAVQFFKSHDGHPNLKLCGLHVHLGSPVLSSEPYVQAIDRLLGLMDQLEAAGHRIEVLNLGGGFGASYRTAQSPSFEMYAAAIVPKLAKRLHERRAAGRKTQIVLEPGRTIAANSGVLLTRVQYIKNAGRKRFVICDAGMNDLLRPALYEAFHFIWPTSVAPEHVPPTRTESPEVPGLEKCDVVGPICETGDFFAIDRPLPPVAPGDLLCVFAAGAYGMTMASRYNSHPLACEVLVDGSAATIVRHRERYQDLIAHELEPEQVAGDGRAARLS